MTNETHEPTSKVDQVVVLLAAGSGTRFVGSCHKLLATLPAEPTPGDAAPGEPALANTVFGRALQHAVAAEIGPVIVVTGALDTGLLAGDTATAELLARADVTIRANPQWAHGQATSLQVGLHAATEYGATSVVVGLADQPFITPDAWRAVAAGTAPITVATYDGKRGNPVRIDAEIWALLPHAGDEGARILMRGRPDLVGEVPCTGSPADIDTVEDLHRWQNN